VRPVGQNAVCCQWRVSVPSEAGGGWVARGGGIGWGTGRGKACRDVSCLSGGWRCCDGSGQSGARLQTHGRWRAAGPTAPKGVRAPQVRQADKRMRSGRQFVRSGARESRWHAAAVGVLPDNAGLGGNTLDAWTAREREERGCQVGQR
jgi:hypothetical protein